MSSGSKGLLGPLVTLVAIATLILQACDSVSVSSVEVGEVEVNPSSAVVPEGGTRQFSAVVRDISGKALAGRPVTWSSNAPSVATVDQSGMVTGLSFGTAAITASTGAAVGSAVALVGQPPRIRLDPTSLTFTAVQGQTPAPKNVAVSNSGELPLEDLTVEVEYGGSETGWVQATLTRSTAPAQVSVEVSAASLGSGTHTATLSVGGPLADNTPQQVAISFTVQSSGPVVTAAPSPVQLSAAEPQKVVSITNGGSGTLADLSASVTYQGRSGWLVASLSRTTAPASLTLSAVVGGLPDGSYNATVTVTGTGGASLAIPVVLSLAPLPPSLDVEPTQVSLAAAVNANAPATTEVAINNGGGGTLSGLTRSIRYGSGQATGWLSASLSSTTAPSTMTVSAAPNGLAQGAYAAVIEVSGNAGNSPRLVQVSFTVLPPPPTPPNSPTGLTANAVASDQIDLSWTDAGGNETGFRVERRVGAGAWSQIATPSANTTTYSDSGLSDGVTYQYRVRACNDAGCSGFSGVASATTPVAIPAVPTSLRVRWESPTQSHLFWFDVSDNEANFELQRRESSSSGSTFAQVATPPANATEHFDNGLTPVRSYAYRIRACNSAGCSTWSNTAEVTTPAQTPSAPSGLSASALSTSTIRLAWSDNDDQEEDQRIERRQDSGPWAQIATVLQDVQAHDDTGLNQGTSYTYRLRACGPGDDCSGYSNEASATTQSPQVPPATPRSLVASVLSAQHVDLAWIDGSNNETSFSLERRRNGTTWNEIAVIPANVMAFRDSGLWVGTTYRYRLKACNAWGCSNPTPDERITTQDPSSVPNAPSNLNVQAVQAGRVDLAWSDNSGNEITFLIQRATGAFGAWADLELVEVGTVTYRDTTVSGSQLYNFRVFACNNIGCSDRSNVVTVVTP